MKWLHGLSGLVLFLLLLAVGGGVIFLSLNPVPWETALNLLKAERLMTLGAGAALILLALIYLLTALPPRPAEEYLTFRNENGSISIGVPAIHEFIAKLKDEFAAVLKLAPRVRPVKGALYVALDVTVRSGTQIPELCRMLQERVKESLAANLGVTDVRDIQVTVREIAPPPPAPRPAQEET